MRRRNYKRALELNRGILEGHERSPRANYNQACILTRLAGQSTSPAAEGRLLGRAERFLRYSFSYKNINMIKIYGGGTDPYQAIASGRGLGVLLAKRRYLLDYLNAKDELKLWFHEKGDEGSGGCVAADMRVALPGGGCVAAGELSGGEDVASWDAAAGAPAVGRVTLARRHKVGE